MAFTMIEWLALAQVIALLGSGLLNLWLYLSMRHDTRWKAIGDAQTAIDRRLSVLETRVETMPTHDDLAEISGQLSRIDRSVGGIEERSASTQDAVRRIERYLLEKKQ